jgi:succinylglutamic semialdehyde dehydrogenase
MGNILTSYNPANGEKIWQGAMADGAMVEKAVAKSRIAFNQWKLTSLEERISLLKNYEKLLHENRTKIADLIALENGKVYREANAEAGALISKIAISIDSYHKRSGFEQSAMDGGVQRVLSHRPHGVMAVFSPYNFPMHLANGHIVPCLLAGNVVLLKPSEETPACGELLVSLLHEAGFAPDVVQLLQGGREVGIALTNNKEIDGILFTGSYATGQKIHQALAGRPETMLALEMGGNNPLIVTNAHDAEAAASIIIDSAFASTGQRCTCARRLILVNSASSKAVLEATLAMTQRITIGAPKETPEPYMSCMINNVQADNVLQGQEMLRQKGGRILLETKRLHAGLPFINAGIIDTTNADRSDDLEIFGSLLQVIHVQNLDEAIEVANQTRYGLSAGLISDELADWDYVYPRLRAGLVNFNRPLTGAASTSPFGGVGVSGNHRPTATYAADYAAYPVSTLAQNEVTKLPLVGIK